MLTLSFNADRSDQQTKLIEIKVYYFVKRLKDFTFSFIAVFKRN